MVTCEDAQAVQLLFKLEAGLDGIIAKQCTSVSASVKALFFNVILARGGFPSELPTSRTVFIPGKERGETPADFRPTSMALVAVRHLHGILAERVFEPSLFNF